MNRAESIRAGLGLGIFVLGSLQAWDSDVPAGGLIIVALVSLAIGLPAVAWLVPVKPAYYMAALGLSFLLLLIARIASPTPLPGLFLVLLPAVMGLILTGLLAQGAGEGAAGPPSI